MRSSVARVVILFAVAAAAVAPRTAAADPVTITGGFVDTFPLGLTARVVFEGQDFSLNIGVEGFFTPLIFNCVPCEPGTTVDLSGRIDHTLAAGTATVDGVHYPLIYADGITGTFTAGSTVLAGEGTQTISLPFVYSGVVNGYVDSPRIGSPSAVFTKTLVGSGTATATFGFSSGEFQPPLFTITDLRYDFGDAAPVPEPASMLLLGSGLAGIAGLRRRARRNARSAESDGGRR